MTFCDFHPHPAPPFPKHPQALACTASHLHSRSAQCPPPEMPFPSTFQLARTRGNELLTGTSMRPNGSIPHPLPFSALCEGLHRWDGHSLGNGESKIWMCLSFYLLYPAQCLALGSGPRSRHLVKFWSRHCLVPDHARTTSPLGPGPLPHLSDGDRFPSGDEEMVRGVSKFTPPKGT